MRTNINTYANINQHLFEQALVQTNINTCANIYQHPCKQSFVQSNIKTIDFKHINTTVNKNSSIQIHVCRIRSSLTFIRFHINSSTIYHQHIKEVVSTQVFWVKYQMSHGSTTATIHSNTMFMHQYHHHILLLFLSSHPSISTNISSHIRLGIFNLLIALHVNLYA